MTTQFRSHEGLWRVASTEQLEPGQRVQVNRRSGQATEVIILARLGHDPARELPYLYAFEDVRRASGAQTQERTEHVAEAAQLMALFDRASLATRQGGQLAANAPAVRFNLANTQRGLRLEMAGPRSRYNGALLALTQERTGSGRRAMYGRLNRDGRFVGVVGATQVELEIFNEVVEVLRSFARDPANYAAAHGRATGNCCFCGRGLTDERSVAVGYGPICADYYGLPWGDTPPPAFDVTQGESERQRERLEENSEAPTFTERHIDQYGSCRINAQGEIINRTLHGIETVTGDALDGWGRQYNVPRTDINGATFESDADYRRAILERMRQMARVHEQRAVTAGAPTLEDMQNEPNGMRRMAMAAQRLIATDVSVTLAPRPESPAAREQVTTTVRRVRPAAAQPAPAPRRTSPLERLRATRGGQATPTDETVTTVQRAVRRDPTTPLEEDDFIWPPRQQ